MLDKRVERKSRLRPWVVLLLAAAAGVATTAGADSLKVSEAVRVNAPQALFPNDNPSRNSSTLASDEKGDQLLVGFEDFQGFCVAPSNLGCPPQNPPGLSGYAFSTNGGGSFTDGGSLFALGTSIPAGHPWVARLGGKKDKKGNDDRDTWFYATMMRNKTTGAGTNLGVYRGHFSGNNFTFDDGQVINPPIAGDFYTREAIAAADDGNSAYLVTANIAKICGVSQAGFGQIEVWRTHDGGDSWQGPVIVGVEDVAVLDPTSPDCGNDGFLQVAPAVSVGPQGEVYVVWQHGPHFFLNAAGAVVNSPDSTIAFASSTDGGQTFTAPVAIAELNAMRDNPPSGYAQNRLNDQPRIAVAMSGPNRGRVYVGIYPSVAPVPTGPATVQTPGSSQAYLIHSDDQGATWSPRVALAPPPPPTGVKRIWPTPSVRTNGDVDVVYLESREVATGTNCNAPIGGARRIGPLNSLVDTYWVQSRDGGATFGTPVKVSSVTSNWCTAPYRFGSFTLSNAGAYIGTVSTSNHTLVTWPDDRNGPMDVFFADIKGHQSDDGGSDDD